MSQYIKLFIKISLATILLLLSHWVITYSNYYYLFIGNILLLGGLNFLVESIIEIITILFEKVQKRKTPALSRVRAIFIIFFIVDAVLRLNGSVETYPERADGNYFSIAQQEKLDSWYWVHTPDTSIHIDKKEFTFNRDVNSLGLSEKEISKEKGSKYRILAIGDSFTEGVGTSYEESWVKQMEKHWVNHNIETINAGIGGSDPVYEFVLYRDKLIEYQPDLVVLTINSSDINDIGARGGFERFHEDGTAGKEAPWWEWIYAANHLYRLVIHRIFNFDSSLVKGSNSTKSKTKAVKYIKEAIHRFAELTEKNGSKLIVALHPSLHDFNQGKYTPFFGQDSLVKFMKENDINCVDTSTEFKKTGADISTYYYPLDSHFNQKGYALFGKTVYEAIEKNNLIPSAESDTNVIEVN